MMSESNCKSASLKTANISRILLLTLACFYSVMVSIAAYVFHEQAEINDREAQRYFEMLLKCKEFEAKNPRKLGSE
jgi:signal transduction histidine kinase